MLLILLVASRFMGENVGGLVRFFRSWRKDMFAIIAAL